MSELPFKYRRLPGWGIRREGLIGLGAARNSLWLGPDHLLSVDRVWMNEEYKRFYFRDIQAITVQKTNTSTSWNWVLATLGVGSAALFGLLASQAISTDRVGFFIAGGIIAGIWFLSLLINLLRGTSCICRLRTAVQNEKLPSLGRVGSARKAIAVLKPLIEETQGSLDAGQIAGHMAPGAQGAAPGYFASNPHAYLQQESPPAPGPQPRVGRPASGLVHAALFGVQLLDAGVGFYTHTDPAWRYYLLVSTVLLLAVTGLSIAAFVTQRETVLPPRLRVTTALTFVWVLVALFVVFMYGIAARTAYSIDHPGRIPSHYYFYSMWAFKPLSLVSDVIEAALGAAGLTMTVLYRFGLQSDRSDKSG
jgi:hypothetical protein